MIVTIQGADGKGNPAEYEAGFKFNNFAFEKLSKMRTDDTVSGNTLAMLYCGYKGWCFVKQIDERLTFENFSDWIDSCIDNPEILEQIKTLLAECVRSPIIKNAQDKIKKNELLKVAV